MFPFRITVRIAGITLRNAFKTHLECYEWAITRGQFDWLKIEHTK